MDRKLTWLQKKLLKKTDFLNYKNEHNRESFVISKFGLKNHEEYRKYNKLVGKISSLISLLRKLPSESRVRQLVTKDLLHTLYRMGVIHNKTSLAAIEKISVTHFCARRVTSVLKTLKMAQNMEHAIQLVEHNHIAAGKELVRDPAMLITRDAEDVLTWAEGSKYRTAIKEFRMEKDDYDDFH